MRGAAWVASGHDTTEHGVHGVLTDDVQVIRPAKLWCDVESAAEARELSEAFGFELVPGAPGMHILNMQAISGVKIVIFAMKTSMYE